MAQTWEDREVDSSSRRERLLIEAGIALSSELELDAVLARLVETAAELTGAQYSALGVLDAKIGRAHV